MDALAGPEVVGEKPYQDARPQGDPHAPGSGFCHLEQYLIAVRQGLEHVFSSTDQPGARIVDRTSMDSRVQQSLPIEELGG
jgi:hypothetical protein